MGLGTEESAVALVLIWKQINLNCYYCGHYCIELVQVLITCNLYVQFCVFNPRSLEQKIVTRTLEGGGGQSDSPLSTFDTIHLTDMKFGTYNELSLYFQLSVITWFLIGFHGKHSCINDVRSGRHLGF